ncbi:PAS domain S-box protein [Thermodesulfobacteriota bacterium]
MIDGKASIIFWNPASERIFGYSSEEAKQDNQYNTGTDGNSPDQDSLQINPILEFHRCHPGIFY